MKKTLLITLDFPPNLGGVAAYYHNMCLNLPQDKIVVLTSPDKRAESFDSSQDFLIIRKSLDAFFPAGSRLSFLNRFKIYFSIFEILKIIKINQIELVQIGNILPLGTLALMMKFWQKIPYLVYAHGLDIAYSQKFWRKRLLMKKIISQADFLVANSNFTKSELLKLGAENDKVTVIYPGFSLELIENSDLQINEFKNTHQLQNKKIILTVGRLVERKGHDQVIKSMSQILTAIPEAVYVIAGDGPYSDQLKKLTADYNLNESVRFLGAVSKSDLALCYQLADVFIMASRQLANGDVEGFGIVYLEANLYGKPVIGGRSGGVSEAIADGKSGLLVDPSSTQEIAAAAIKILSDRDYAQSLGAYGKIRASEEFSWAKQMSKLSDIFK